MIFLVISIICSVLVASLFKIAKQKNITIFPIIHINYIIAIICCYFIFDANYNNLILNSDNTLLYTVLGFLLPTLFIILSKSINSNGIIKTDIAQRFSLIIPILVSIFFWNQTLSTNKILGLIIGFIAIILILYKKQNNKSSSYYFYPILVLLGYGIVDVLFKRVALIKNIPYTSSLLIIFTFAFFISCFIGYYLYIKKQAIYNLNSILWGIGLGVLNFINIFTYIKAHQVFYTNPAVVFATMNFGVILLSTIFGYLYFKENIDKFNTIGIFLSLLAIALITLF